MRKLSAAEKKEIRYNTQRGLDTTKKCPEPRHDDVVAMYHRLMAMRCTRIPADGKYSPTTQYDHDFGGHTIFNAKDTAYHAYQIACSDALQRVY